MADVTGGLVGPDRPATNTGAMTPQSVTDAVSQLHADGFVADLAVVDRAVRDLSAAVDHEPEELLAVELHRFADPGRPDGSEAVVVGVGDGDGSPLGTLVVHLGPSAPADGEYVLEHLRRTVLTQEPSPPFETGDRIAAVFESVLAADAALATLRARGVDDENLGVAVRQGSALAFEPDRQHDLARSILPGAIGGAAVGAVAGIVLVALLGRGVDDLGVAGLLAAAAVGAFVGGVIGAYVGFARRTSDTEDPVHIDHQQLAPGQVLVIVRAGHDRAEVTEVLAGAGGRLVPGAAGND